MFPRTPATVQARIATAPPAALPPRGELHLELAADRLDTVDFLALSGCALQVNIGRRNSGLGRGARDSQRLLLDLEYLQLAPACIDYQRAQGNHALVATLQRARTLKYLQLPAAIYNATLGGDEYRAFWNTPAPVSAGFPATSGPAVAASLKAINRQARRWLAGNFSADNREFEILLGEVAAGNGYTLLRALAAPPQVADPERCRQGLLPPILELEQLLAAVLPPAYREWRGHRDGAPARLSPRGLPRRPVARGALPALHPAGVEPEQVQDPTDTVVDDIVYSLGGVIKSRHGRTDHHTHQRGLVQQPGMAHMQGRLPRHQHQPPALLEHDVSRPHHQVIRIGIDHP
jgi:hypothetical protein